LFAAQYLHIQVQEVAPLCNGTVANPSGSINSEIYIAEKGREEHGDSSDIGSHAHPQHRFHKSKGDTYDYDKYPVGCFLGKSCINQSTDTPSETNAGALILQAHGKNYPIVYYYELLLLLLLLYLLFSFFISTGSQLIFISQAVRTTASPANGGLWVYLVWIGTDVT
jgi:hypothetical protein